MAKPTACAVYWRTKDDCETCKSKDPDLDQSLAGWFSDQRRQGAIKNSSICANWLTVCIITVNTQHVHVNTLSFNSVLFYFLQDFLLIAWCSDYAFVNCESKYHRECSSQYTRKVGWMKKVFFFCCLFSVNLSIEQLFSAGIVRNVTSFVPFNRHGHFPYWRLAIRRTPILEQIEVVQAKFLSKMLQKMEFGFRLAERN